MAYGDSSNTRTYGGSNDNGNGVGHPYNRNNDRPRFSAAPRYEAPAAAVPVVEVPKIPVNPKSRDLMFFKGNHYAVEMLRAQSKGGPLIEISRSELQGIAAMPTSSRELPAEVLDLAPVFAKYEGKYVVLLGMKSIVDRLSTVPEEADIKFKGRLLSNPSLKRCIV